MRTNQQIQQVKATPNNTGGSVHPALINKNQLQPYAGSVPGNLMQNVAKTNFKKAKNQLQPNA